ncbi:MAG TPA: FRG domain-containing protein, partial [Planctomycetaceae bacterium]|nr:FRG domain-containing protein [Planctomycetaceae bacterium]
SFADWPTIEKHLIETFRQEGAPYIANAPKDDLEWLMLAQHHGVPTRLLDWTTSPTIALFFAVEENWAEDADVWCLGFPSTHNCLPRSTHFARRLTLRKTTIVVFPTHISPRIVNQDGCFTIHDSAVPLNDRPDIKALSFRFVRLRIKAADKPRIMDDLFNMGVHRAFIFPGLDGLAKKIVYEATVMCDRRSAD